MELEEYKLRKIQGFCERAEADYWAFFIEHPDDVPLVAYGHVVARLATGGQVKADSKNRLIASGEVAPKLRTKCDAVRAATSYEAVDAIVW